MKYVRRFHIALGLLATVTAPALGQSIDENMIHNGIAAAIGSGASEYVIPNGELRLTRQLWIPPGTRNFTLRGSGNTTIRRASTTDFPLVMIGDGRPLAFANSAWSSLPQVSVQPVAEGARTLTRTGGIGVTPGVYVLLGTDPEGDRVGHPNDPTFEYWFKREIVRVTRVEGNTVHLDIPVGRDFTRAELRRLEDSSTRPADRILSSNIRLQDLTLNGASTIDGGRTRKIVNVGLQENFSASNLTIREFHNAALGIMMSRGVTVSNVDIRDGNTVALGYGVEIAASRFITVRDSFFANHRWGVVFTSGCQDALIEDCDYANGPTGGFDGGHGTNDRRITYRRCRGPIFSIANPAFLRGAHDVRLEQCTAYAQINIYGNTTRIVVDGKHPEEPITAPLIQFFAEGYSNTPYTFPMDVTLRNGVSDRGVLDGTNLQLVSVSQAPRGLGNLLVQNWSFKNSSPNAGRTIALSNVSTPSNITFENCSFDNRANPRAEPIAFGPVVGQGRWNVTFRNSRFMHANMSAVAFINGAAGSITQTGNQINGVPLTNSNINGLSTLRQ